MARKGRSLLSGRSPVASSFPFATCLYENHKLIFLYPFLAKNSPLIWGIEEYMRGASSTMRLGSYERASLRQDRWGWEHARALLTMRYSAMQEQEFQVRGRTQLLCHPHTSRPRAQGSGELSNLNHECARSRS